jgi:hypothetical protein
MIGNSMTMARQRGKPRHAGAIAAFAALALALFAARHPAAAATTERVVVDPHSGLAISGFDPVAYFTDAEARPGRDAFEQAFAGAVWRFRNEGNLAAFAADPDVYMPRFGGHDPTGVARGAPVPGNPRFWLIWNDRLYLFYSDEARDAFAHNSADIDATADQAWVALQPKLAQ